MTNELLAEVSLLREKVKKYEEAWKKVKEEINQKQTLMWSSRHKDGLQSALITINKYLQEVENADSN